MTLYSFGKVAEKIPFSGTFIFSTSGVFDVCGGLMNLRCLNDC